jgi:hypothetical protein
LWAQQPQLMGTVATHDALVTGGLEVRGESARLISNASVTAYDHTAEIALERGGEVLVCATSEFHLLHSGTGTALLFGLDRGAVELHTRSNAQDVILTPDIRFTAEAQGTFDLRLRVTRDGDTCVENAGERAPVLVLSDAFTSATYRLMPGQHVLFERGNLREVVDHERSPCGCPAPAGPAALAADATPAQKAAAEHPFPVAASEGLSTAQPVVPPAGDGTVVSTSFRYGAQQTQPSVAETAKPAAVSAVPAAPPRTPPGAHEIVHAIGHFFHKLFHPHSQGRPPAP